MVAGDSVANPVSRGNCMDKKPKIKYPVLDRAESEAAYFFLRGFRSFFPICARSLGGVASIRRANSSSEIGAGGGFGSVGMV